MSSGVLSQVLSGKIGATVTAVSTGASKENIQNINGGNNNLGIVQNDVMAYAYEGTKNFADDGAVKTFRTIAGLYAEQVQIVTLNPDIKTVADLKGKSVSIGAAGSGVYYNAIDVLAAYGMTEQDVSAKYPSFQDSAESLKDGKIDAAFVVAGAPTTAITELATAKSVNLVSIDEEHMQILMENCPYYVPHTITSDTYKGMPSDAQTVAIKATLIVEEKATDEDVYNITKAIFENIDAITSGHSKGSELSLQNAVEGISVPFHAGAAKYFAEQGITVDAG